MSSIQIDGTHAIAKGDGQEVGYQERKSSMTTNLLCISDAYGVLMATSQPISGYHHNLFEIEKHFDNLIQMLDNVGIEFS